MFHPYRLNVELSSGRHRSRRAWCVRALLCFGREIRAYRKTQPRATPDPDRLISTTDRGPTARGPCSGWKRHIGRRR